MKVKLEFDLDNPKEVEQYQKYLQAEKMYDAILEFSINSRNKIEQGINLCEVDGHDLLDVIYRDFENLLIKNKVDIGTPVNQMI